MNINELAEKWGLSLARGSHGLFDELDIMLWEQCQQIEALKRPNNVVGVPQDKLAEMQATIRELEAENKKVKAKLKGWQDGVLELMNEDREFFSRRHYEQQAEIELLRCELNQYLEMSIKDKQ